ncbi:MAG: hypothetical protein GXY14_05820 [Spirochaetes bacterium]|nr:hypothetical protein [Spirochaetota bacterium]
MRLISFVLSMFISTVLLSCSIIKHSPCQENCEYNRRDCVQMCGDPDKAGFKLKLGGDWAIGSVDSCIRECNIRSDECLERCRTENKKEPAADE